MTAGGGERPAAAGSRRGEGGSLHWGWRLFLFVLLVTGLWFLAALVSAWAAAPWVTGDGGRQWGFLLLLVATVAASWIAAEGFEGIPLSALGTPLDRFAPGGFLRGAAVGGLLMATALGVLAAAGWLGWSGEPGLGALPGAALRLTLLYAAAAFMEELLLRGYPLQVLAEGVGGPAAILLTAVAFSLLHFLNPDVGALALVNLGLAGVLLGVAYWRTYSLWFATGVHFGWNWVMGFLADVPVSGLREAAFDTPGWEAHLAGPTAWTGGAFGPEGGLVVTAVTVAGVWWLATTDRLQRDPRILALAPIPERRRADAGRRGEGDGPGAGG